MGGDFLKVFLHLEGSGVSEYTPWSGVLCGDLRDVPQVLYSSRSTLILEFHTQESSSSNATGFFGNFHFIDRRKLSFEYFFDYRNKIGRIWRHDDMKESHACFIILIPSIELKRLIQRQRISIESCLSQQSIAIKSRIDSLLKRSG